MPASDLFLFVSHVAEDRASALEVVDELERRGVRCWIAPRDVHPGRPFDDEIVDAIEASRAMLLIFSEHCNASDYIRREVTVAGESHKLIIPFRIEEVTPRRGLRVRLSDLHWIDGFVSRERAVDQVVHTVDPDGLLQRERLRQENAQRAEEEERVRQADATDKAEEARKAEDAQQAEALRRAGEVARQAEVDAERDAEARRQAEEIARRAEVDRLAEEDRRHREGIALSAQRVGATQLVGKDRRPDAQHGREQPSQPTPREPTDQKGWTRRVLAVAAVLAAGLLLVFALKGHWGAPAASPELLRTLAGDTDGVECVAFSPDGRTLAWGGYNRTIQLWDIVSGRALITLTGADITIGYVAFSPDGRTLAVGGAQHAIKLLDAASWRVSRTLGVSTGGIASVAFSPDGRILASASQNEDTISLWDAANGAVLRTLSAHVNFIGSVAFSPDGRLLASASTGSSDPGQAGIITLWDQANGKALRTLTEAAHSIAFSPDGKAIASAGGMTIKLWDPASGQLLRTLTGHTDYVDSVAFSADRRLLASGSLDKTIKLWDPASGQLLRTLSGHTGYVTAIAFSPDGRTLISGSLDNTVKVWDVSAIAARK